MKQLFMLFGFAAILLILAACNSYGKKVKINDHLEVYYKGDSITEAAARNLGDYLAKNFAGKKESSVQLTKDSGMYIVRFVVDKAGYEQQPAMVKMIFRMLPALIAENVFSKAPTKVILASETFKDIAVAGTSVGAGKERLDDTLDTTSFGRKSLADSSLH